MTDWWFLSQIKWSLKSSIIYTSFFPICRIIYNYIIYLWYVEHPLFVSFFSKPNQAFPTPNSYGHENVASESWQNLLNKMLWMNVVIQKQNTHCTKQQIRISNCIQLSKIWQYPAYWGDKCGRRCFMHSIIPFKIWQV